MRAQSKGKVYFRRLSHLEIDLLASFCLSRGTRYAASCLALRMVSVELGCGRTGDSSRRASHLQRRSWSLMAGKKRFPWHDCYFSGVMYYFTSLFDLIFRLYGRRRPKRMSTARAAFHKETLQLCQGSMNPFKNKDKLAGCRQAAAVHFGAIYK